MKETKHDYQNCIMGNFYDSKCTREYECWEDFREIYLGFNSTGFDDRYHFVFRYDIDKKSNELYQLELCIMLQRKGIYTHIYINNISQDILDTEVKSWLKSRYDYIKKLWIEVIE